MQNTLFKLSLVISLLFFLLISTFALGALKTLDPDDYEKWERLTSTNISPDGNWVSYLIARENKDTLYLKNLTTDSLYQFAFGSRVAFSEDSKWAAIRSGFSKKKMDQMKEKKQAVEYNMVLINLETGEKRCIDKISSFTFSRKSNFISCTKYKVKGSKAKDDDVVLYDLNTGNIRTIGNVKMHSFNKKGDYFAYIINTADKFANSVELFNLNTYELQVIDSDTLTYSKLTWEKEGNALAFMKELEHKDFEEASNVIYACRNIYSKLDVDIFNPQERTDFPDSMYVSNSSLDWSTDLKSLAFGIKKWSVDEKMKKEKERKAKEKKKQDEKAKAKADTLSVADDTPKIASLQTDSINGDTKPKLVTDKKKSDSKKDEKLPGVDIWHWNDSYIQPRQKKTYNSDKNFTFQSVWQIEKDNFIQVANDSIKYATLSSDHKHAYCYTRVPYQPAFRLTYADYYHVDLSSGTREMILQKYTGRISFSPAGKYILYFKDKNWYTYDLTNKKHIDLTSNIDSHFWNTRYDGPAEVKPPFGSGPWMKDDKMVYLYDEYDVWELKPDGSSSSNITRGKDREVIGRINKLDYEYSYLDPKEPIYLRMFGDKTKKSGYSLVKSGVLKELIFVDEAVGSLRKAKRANKFTYSTQSYENSPALFCVDASFANPDTIVKTNLQQKDYAWGKTELIEFTNKLGKKMQGSLYYPANYEEGKTYPMVVYIYERLSNGIHSYINPSKKSFYNVTNYVQQGFFVFKPDIVYELNDPGISAVNCVVPAVEKVLETGMIDKDKVGIMGHSWGAYQTAFLITQTKLFSAAVAGAPLTDLISMYTEIYWNTGNSNQGIFETSQGRFTKPYWEQLDKYIDNSPMFNAQNITTPLLVAFGDKDGAVDWHQGIELYSTMRRMQKEMIMLVYADENHAVRKEENALDYTKKINEFFNYYLLGKEPKTWITKGMSYEEKMKKEAAKKKK